MSRSEPTQRLLITPSFRRPASLRQFLTVRELVFSPQQRSLGRLAQGLILSNQRGQTCSPADLEQSPRHGGNTHLKLCLLSHYYYEGNWVRLAKKLTVHNFRFIQADIRLYCGSLAGPFRAETRLAAHNHREFVVPEADV